MVFESPVLLVNTYTRRPATVEAVQWTGVNDDEISEIAPVHRSGSILQVREADGRWVTLHAGWWVSRNLATKLVTVHSEDAFADSYE